MNHLRITTRPDGPRVVLVADGELDAASSDLLRAAFEEVVQAGQHTVVDVSALTFCDSSSLRLLLSLRDRCAAGGGRLVLAGARGVLARLLHITGLNRAFVLAESVEAAAC
ncbi:STAS domain-containing protein [Microbispora cellulosiformans]|uniref:Anti-sigma factor antagonist n=1 Tax=Microbispora cellulosiformans TaxID=2614688 RepID=A0A5J5K597_9ACTN|nr:STAS domain-containing protein [Microbispora cellulosiformans]KAA9379642.1 STAS domain-containing protein [Microbispora cellulosiformans]